MNNIDNVLKYIEGEQKKKGKKKKSIININEK